MEYLKGVGLRISTLRKSQGITQEGLAQMVGYTSRSSINKIERGLVDLPQSKIKDIAQALGTTPTYIMGIEETSPISEESLTEEEKEMLDIFRLIPEGDQRVFLEMGRAYANTLKKG